MESSYILACAFLLILVLVLFAAVIFLLYKSQKLQREFNLMEDTLKQWRSNFNELRGMCDLLAKSIDATNKRVDFLNKCNEDNIPVIEAMKEMEARHGEKT